MRPLLILLAALAFAAPAHAAEPCNRACLYKVLDAYLAALKARDASKAPLAAHARNSENNVMLAPGDGMWATLAELRPYDLRFADPKTGGVGFYGVVEEAGTASPFALRLKVSGGKITEAETVVARPQDAGVPFVTTTAAARPAMNEILPPSARSPRAKTIALADGYFSTLERNDGTIRTRFAPDCNRLEDGYQTTNNPAGTFSTVMGLGCEAQFKLGNYRYDDRLRARRYFVVDEERGIVMAAAFIDHSGRLGEYTLTDGRKVVSSYRRPHTLCVLEAFRIRDGQIAEVESVFTSVPYRMPSSWTASAQSLK